MKPLYLLGREQTDVVLDGPALRVSRNGHADARVPLRRLARVIVSGRVNWATNALLACADHDVPVVFLRRSGTVRARWLGICSRRDGWFYRNWSYLIDRPDWRQQYGQWRRSALQRATALSVRRMGLTIRREPEELEHDFNEFARFSVGDDRWAAISKRLDGLAEAHAVAGLASYGLQWKTAEMQKLAGDLRRMIVCGLFPELHNSLRSRNGLFSGDDCVANSVKFFERNRSVADFSLRLGIESLCRFLEDLS